MPLYTILNTETGEESTVNTTYSKFKKMLEENPHIEWVPGGLKIVSGVDGLLKTEDVFNDRLKHIQKAHPKGKVIF